MRTSKQEVGRILAELDGQLQRLFDGTKFADIGLAELAFRQLLESANAGVSLEEMMSDLLAKMANFPIPQEYLQHVLKACAHSVSATLHSQSGNEIGAWQQLSDAKNEAGCALALFVNSSEQHHRKTAFSTSGGNSRGGQNAKLREFVLTEWKLLKLGDSNLKPGTAAKSIADRFFSPRGNPYQRPALNLDDYDAETKLDGLERAFGDWIRKSTNRAQRKIKNTVA
ncbi:MAG: hypothetical protein HHJ17_08580 [Rhodoferax sp.]|nr:hypothetical protein [Rhodoferax sp.]